MERKTLIIIDVVLFILGLILIAIGGALIPFFDRKIKDTVENNVKLVNNSDAFKAWKDPPAPIYLEFYFFNVTNPADITRNNSKPRLEEFGPFTYREYRNKTDINITENGDKIYYKEHKYYVFQEEQNAKHNDSLVICTLNIPILALATQLRNSKWSWLQPFLRIVLKYLDETLIQCHTVKELLWGYTPESVKIINEFLAKWRIPFRFHYTYGIYSGPTANGTDDGELEIYSGVQNIKDLGQVAKWRGNSSLPFWHDSCNQINGSDGTLWHPFVDRTETLYIFNTDLCRSVYVTYNGSSVISASRIAAYHFTPPLDVMADPRNYSANRCFCSPYDANGTFCLGAGVLNVTKCRQDAPVIMSEPHFLEAPEYEHEVLGLKPDRAKHQTIIDVEPITGLVLNAAKRIQVNMYVTKLESLIDTENFTKGLVFPISWVNEHATIPDDVAATFYQDVIVPMKEADGIRYGLIAVGGFILLCALVLLLVICVKRKKGQESKAEPDETSPLLSE